MTQEALNFNEEKDFGGVLNITFNYVGQNYKSLLKALLIFAGPFILLGSISGAFFNVHNFETITKIESRLIMPNFYFVYLLLMIIGYLFSYIMILLTIFVHIKVYREHPTGNITMDQLWPLVRTNFLRIFFALILQGIIIAFGTILFIIPGVYLGICLSLLTTIMIFEDCSFGDAFNRCFYLIKHRWWMTLGLLMAVGMVSSMAYYIFLIPQYVILFGEGLHSTGISVSSKYILLTMSMLGLIVLFLSSSLTVITMVAQYFSLVEHKEKPSLLRKVMEIQDETYSGDNNPEQKF